MKNPKIRTMQNHESLALHIVMDDESLGVKETILAAMYSSIDAKARQLAPENLRNELRISQDSKVRTRFNVVVSGRMAPYLISAIESQASAGYGIVLTSYFQKLQEQVMAQLFADTKDVIQ